MALRSKLSPSTPVEIPIDLFVEDLTQPRQKFEDAQQQELNESVKAAGIHVPIEVQSVMVDKRQMWKVIKGARRYRAAKNALLPTIPCVLASVKTLREIHRSQVLENTNRADLDPVDFGVALYTEYFADQILALAQEQGSAGDAIVEGVFEQVANPVERMVALRDTMCQLAGTTTMQEYMSSGRVRVPMKTVLARVGKGSLGEQQTRKILAPVRQIEPDVLAQLLGSGTSVRALTELGKLPGDEQRQVVGDAQQAAAQDDGNLGRALRGVLDTPLDRSASGTAAQIDDRDSEDDFADSGVGGAPAIMPIAGGKGEAFEPDPSLAFLTGPSGNAQKLITDRPAPARGRTPPADHGTMNPDDYLQFSGALETIITILDRSGATALSAAQLREAGAMWGEIVERCTTLGLAELV